MTKEEVFALARDAAFHTQVMEGELLRFAALVAAHEREECAKAIDDSANICAPGSIQTVLREQARCIRSRT